MTHLNLVEGILRWKNKRWEYPTFDERGFTKWGWYSKFPENLKIGMFVDIGAFTYISATFSVKIETSVQIGSHNLYESGNTSEMVIKVLEKHL